MANNGYLVGSVCVTETEYVSSVLCPSLKPDFTYYRIQIGPSVSHLFYCLNNTSNYVGNSSLYNCDLSSASTPSTIPTVADGIALGWQAGAALILVGCILFLKKALK